MTDSVNGTPVSVGSEYAEYYERRYGGSAEEWRAKVCSECSATCPLRDQRTPLHVALGLDPGVMDPPCIIHAAIECCANPPVGSPTHFRAQLTEAIVVMAGIPNRWEDVSGAQNDALMPLSKCAAGDIADGRVPCPAWRKDKVVFLSLGPQDVLRAAVQEVWDRFVRRAAHRNRPLEAQVLERFRALICVPAVRELS